MSTAYTIECTVQLCRQGHGGRSTLCTDKQPPQLPGRIPRLARQMALALRFEKLLATGVVKDFHTLARLGHVSSARISQIMSLLHLAPDIQEAILFGSRPERGRDCLDLRKVLALTKVWNWQEQRRLWCSLSSALHGGLVGGRSSREGCALPAALSIGTRRREPAHK